MGPSVNQMYRKAHANSKFGKTLSPEFKQWTAIVAPLLMRYWREQEQPIVSQPWALYLRLGLNNRSDIDGRCKAIIDMLPKTIPGWPDDRWMNRLVVERGGDLGVAYLEATSLPTT